MKSYACPKKIQARYRTIIEAYWNIFGRKLPKTKQYWTLCAAHVSDQKELLEGSELQQILEVGLVSQEQFYGVDRDKNIIEINSEFLPNAKWHCDDFYTALSKASPFNPAIVNFDLLEGPKTGAYQLGRILHLITKRSIRNVMVVANFILKSRFNPDVGIDAIVEHLDKITNFKHAFAEGKWKVYKANKVYCYEGTGGKSKTKMGTIVFYRKGVR